MRIKYVEAMIGGDSGSEPHVISVEMPELMSHFVKAIIARLNQALPDLGDVPADVIAALADDLADSLCEIVESKQDSAHVEFDDGEPASLFRPIGTGESVERQLGNAFLSADLVAIVKLDDLLWLIACAEREESSVAV